MPWTRNQTKQLRTRQDEIEDLRNEEQKERLGEMCLDPNDGERHSRDVA